MNKHIIKRNYSDGEKLPEPILWCGRKGDNFTWYFLTAQHAALAVGGSNSMCKNCIKSIIKELSKEL